ncbi:hypothetical protein FTV91_02730 [Escherichia coli]|nr:hypothetical protein FTV91_02730 [Escherichia coli]
MCFASLLLWSQPASRIPVLAIMRPLSVDDVLSVSFFYPFINDYLTIAVRSLRFKKRNAIDKNKKE